MFFVRLYPFVGTKISYGNGKPIYYCDPDTIKKEIIYNQETKRFENNYGQELYSDSYFFCN